MPEILLVPPEQVTDERWARLLPLLEKVVTDKTDWTVEAVVQDLILGHTQLWSLNDLQAMLITRVIPRPKRKVLLLEWLSGEAMKEWYECEQTLVEFAKVTGCSIIEGVTARRGFRYWVKKLTGYEPEYTVYRKAVEG